MYFDNTNHLQIFHLFTVFLIVESLWLKLYTLFKAFTLDLRILEDYLCKLVGKSSGSKQVAFVALGVGTLPNATHATLANEIMLSTQRKAPDLAITSSKTLRFTATFYSSDSFLTGASDLQNIGLYSGSSGVGLFAGNTYASSSCNTNQNVNVTYDIEFS